MKVLTSIIKHACISVCLYKTDVSKEVGGYVCKLVYSGRFNYQCDSPCVSFHRIFVCVCVCVFVRTLCVIPGVLQCLFSCSLQLFLPVVCLTSYHTHKHARTHSHRHRHTHTVTLRLTPRIQSAGLRHHCSPCNCALLQIHI